MTQEEANKLKELIQAQVDEPKEEEFVPKVGQLCWFWDSADRDPEKRPIGTFEGMAGGLFKAQTGTRWMNCAPYIAKGTRQPWSGGDCPVDKDALVVFEMRYGGIDIRKVGDVQWRHKGSGGNIIAYWELER